MYAKTSAIEPIMPPISDTLRANAERVIEEASMLRLPVETEVVFHDLLQQMNCYYSSSIEGVNIKPIDIQHALKGGCDEIPANGGFNNWRWGMLNPNGHWVSW